MVTSLSVGVPDLRNSMDLDFGVCNRFWSLAAVYKNSKTQKEGKGRKRGKKWARKGKAGKK